MMRPRFFLIDVMFMFLCLWLLFNFGKSLELVLLRHLLLLLWFVLELALTFRRLVIFLCG